MKLRFQVLLVAVIFFNYSFLIAQNNNDSIQKKSVAYIVAKFPVTRIFNIEYSNVAPYNYTGKTQNTSLPEDKVKSYQQVKANANFYFLRKKSWVVSSNLNFRYTFIDTPTESANESFDNQFYSLGVTATHISKLFDKTITYTAIARVDANEKSLQRMRGYVIPNMVITANEKTKFMVGLVGIIDPSSQVPLVPLITYERKFGKNWTLDMLLPQRLMLRKFVGTNSRVSLGSEIDVNSFYLEQNSQNLEFRQTDLNTGLLFEHYYKDFIFSLRGGSRSVINSRMFLRSKSQDDYIYDFKPESALFFNVGISYSPFSKLKK